MTEKEKADAPLPEESHNHEPELPPQYEPPQIKKFEKLEKLILSGE